MAMYSKLRRASSSVLPLAFRAMASTRTFHYAASAVRTSGLNHRLIERILLSSVRLANSFATKTSAGENVLRVLDTEIQCAEEEDHETRIFPQTVALSRLESKNGLASILGDPRSSLFHQAAALAPHFPSRFMSTQISSVESSQDSSTPVSEVPPRIKFKRLDKTAKHIMQIIDKEAVEEVRTHREIPDIQPGYIVQLKVEVPENKRRVSIIKGIVIARRNAGLNTTFRIRRLVAGVGIESLFPLYSPNIKEIKVLEKKRVRRAKLYYLREKMDALKKQ